MKRRGTELGEGLDKLARRLNRAGGGGVKQIRVHQAWVAIAGPTVIDHTIGAHLRAGELVVYVDSPVWATELSALAEQYRAALNQDLGEELVSGVRFAVSRKVDDSARLLRVEAEQAGERNADKVPSVPLSVDERARVEESAAVIKDEALREAAIRATVADLEWKKGIEASKSAQKPRGGS